MPVGHHRGIAEHGRPGREGRDSAFRRAGREGDVGRHLHHAAGVNNTHRHALLGRLEAPQVGLGADDGEAPAVDLCAVADVVGAHSAAIGLGGAGTRATAPFFRASGRSFQGMTPSSDSA